VMMSVKMSVKMPKKLSTKMSGKRLKNVKMPVRTAAR